MCTRNSFTLYFLLHKFSRSIDYSDEVNCEKRNWKKRWKCLWRIVFFLSMISTFLNVKWRQKVNGDSIWIFLDWPRVFGYSVNMHQICNRASFDEASASGLRWMHPFHTSNKKMKTFLKIKTFGIARHDVRSLSLE